MAEAILYLQVFTFETCYLVRCAWRDENQAVSRLLQAHIKNDGQIGGTGWTVVVTASGSATAWEVQLEYQGAPAIKAFLAGTEAVSAATWLAACAEADAVGQLRPGTVRRTLEAPWMAIIRLTKRIVESRPVETEAMGLAAYVAYTTLERINKERIQ